MEETKIKLETAVLAKEKNFNWTCSHRYTYYKKEYRDSNYQKIPQGTVEKSVNFINNSDCYSCKIMDNYARPTQSLLAKWLREVHNIDVWASKIGTTSEKKYYFQIMEKDCWAYTNNSNSTSYLTFEEALEVGLFEGLGLIKE